MNRNQFSAIFFMLKAILAILTGLLLVANNQSGQSQTFINLAVENQKTADAFSLRS